MVAPVIGDRFRLLRPLGQGAMGQVWLAEHLALGMEVAVKLIHAEAARQPNSRARFAREAKLVAHIQSAHVVRVLDHGTTPEGLPFIAMEYLEGESLGDRLRARGRLTPAETALVVRDVCRAMTKAHELGLVHRDLKPDNVFLAATDDGEIAKVLDFGVAKATDLMAGAGVDPTRTGALLGTPFYMSPEQAQGLKSVDWRSDLWALGVIVYECLTGELPFKGASLGAIVAGIMTGPISPPSSLAPDNAHAAIDAWLARALCRDPAGRFQSARELGDAFQEAVGSPGPAVDQASSRPPPPADGLDAAVPPAGAATPGRVTGGGTIILADEALAEPPLPAPALGEANAPIAAAAAPPRAGGRGWLVPVLVLLAVVAAIAAMVLAGCGPRAGGPQPVARTASP